jgi:hypothetical protein
MYHICFFFFAMRLLHTFAFVFSAVLLFSVLYYLFLFAIFGLGIES